MSERPLDGVAPDSGRVPAEPNGQRSPDPAVPAGGPSPLTYWWNPPSRELVWQLPLLPLQDGLPGAVPPEELLAALEGEVPAQRLKFWLLLWRYHTRARAALSELLAIEREARAKLEERGRELLRQQGQFQALERQREALSAEAQAARTAFGAAAAAAGLACEARPEAVERDFYDRVMPTLNELAGEHGMGPVHETGPQWPPWLRQLLVGPLRVLAPVVAGLILALTMGTLIGLLSVVDLQRGDRLRQLLLAGLLGFVIVYLLGELVSYAAQLLARSREPVSAAAPRLRGSFGLAIAVFSAAAVLGAAEVATEALGIRELHRQYLVEARRLGNTALDTPLLSTWVYVLIGTLISGPYLVYKAVSAWNEHEARHREAWLLHLQSGWVDRRRAAPEFQAAIAAAQRAQQLEQELARLDAQLDPLREQLERGPALDDALKARLDRAREAAVGERGHLDLFLEELIRDGSAQATAAPNAQPLLNRPPRRPAPIPGPASAAASAMPPRAD
jgi:hypothetical protein